MIDEKFKVWLIEVNTNPDITVSSPVLARVIPPLLENVLRVAVDPIFPPFQFLKSKKQLIPHNIYENNKFELIFDEKLDGTTYRDLYKEA